MRSQQTQYVSLVLLEWRANVHLDGPTKKNRIAQ